MFIIDAIRFYINCKRIKKYMQEYSLPRRSKKQLSIPSLDKLLQKTKKELTDRA